MASDIFKYCVVKYSTLTEHSSDSHTDNTFPGSWHTLKIFALALSKIYGPVGLEALIALLHHGRTANCIINGTDFDKTCSFLLQSWEAMYRLEIDMF